MNTSNRGLTRRNFLKQSAAVAGPMILGSGVLASGGKVGANDRIVIGQIGIGGIGTNHLKFCLDRETRTNDVAVGALCDVDEIHLGRAVERVGRKIDTYGDYRRLLERDDLDAVIIAVPDHWHGIIAVQACEAGKDVYVEKPSSKTIEEGRAMIDAARRNKRVMQVGSQGRSQTAAQAAYNYIQNGQIGDVNRVECWHYENPTGGDWNLNQAPPSHLDWNMWLGPAQWVPYNPDRVHFNFRWFLDFGGGQIRDRGAHVLSVVSWVLGLDDKQPVRVVAKGDPPVTGMWDCPPNLEVEYTFEKPDLKIYWRQPGPNPIDDKFGAVYHGTKDQLIVRGGDGFCDTEAKAKDYTPPSKGKHAFVSPGHHQNWFDCIRSREKPIMDIEAGHSVATMCILANLSYRIGRPIEWNGKKERIVGDEAANHLLGSPGRGEFHL